MQKVVFLDRDGTINIDKNYLYKKNDFEFLPGAVEGLRILYDLGYLLIIITNQSGIARGYYSENDFKELNDWMIDTLYDEGIRVHDVLFCPHLPNAVVPKYRVECCCRKPKLGLFKYAIKKYGIDLSYSWAIGDRLRDCTICDSTNCKGILVGNTENVDIIESIKREKREGITYKTNLLEAANYIRLISELENNE